MSGSSQAFAEIYTAVRAEVLGRLEAHGVPADEAYLEPESIAEHCFLDVPIEALVAIPNDNLFVESCAYKVKDRPATVEEREQLLGNLAEGMSKRECLARFIEQHNQVTIVIATAP